MGPAPNANLPARPKFSWDAKSPPWTDGKGDQQEYRDAVKLWQKFHDALPDSNNNKILTVLQAICLKSQLFGRAKDLCSGITEAELTQNNAVELIVGQIYQKDALSVVSEAYRVFNQVWNTRRSSNETMKNFESRFSAQVAKFNSISTTTRLPECITALMLLSNSAIDDSQRISVMAAAAPSNETLTSQSTNYEFLSSITYQSVASVLKQCDKTSPNTSDNNPLAASSASTGNYRGQRGSRYRNKGISPTMKYPCDICGKYGHWKRNHNQDGSLPSHVKYFDTPSKQQTSGSDSGEEEEAANSSNQSKDKTKPRSISFNMGTLTGSLASTRSTNDLGPLLDDGAPYSAIGLVELNLLADHIKLPSKLNGIPKALGSHTHWQYGTGQHASPSRRILGSIVLTAKSDQGTSVGITHLVLDGSSQWVIGKNVTCKSNIEHIDRNALVFIANGETEHISLIDHEFLSYLPLNIFLSSDNSCSTLSSMSALVLENAPWSDIKKVVDKVHKHVCGHANFTDYKLLLERNRLWNDVIASYLTELVNSCTACRSTSVPQSNRKVSISSLSKNFNEILCVDHLYLDNILLTHFMDLVTRYSSAHIVTSKNLKEAVTALEASWVFQFWYPESIRADKAFQVGDFKSYADKLGIVIELVPPRRHSKNAIESKHNIIRSIFLRLKEDAGDEFDPSLAAYKAISISNDLYGNDTMSAFELTKGFSKPIAATPHETVLPDDIRDAQEQLQARRKLALILRSKAISEVPLSVGESVEVFQKKDHEKRGKWSDPRPILSIDAASRSLQVPGRKGREVTVAFEDARPALKQQSFAQIIQEGIDTIEESQSEQISELTTEERKVTIDADLSTENTGVQPNVGDNVFFFGLKIKSTTQDGYTLKKMMVV